MKKLNVKKETKVAKKLTATEEKQARIEARIEKLDKVSYTQEEVEKIFEVSK